MATPTEVQEVTIVEAPVTVAHTEGLCDICHKPISKGKEVDGLIVGATCAGHVGKIRLYAVGQMSAPPEGYLRMSKVCDAAVEAGLTRSAIVTAAGKDACTQPPVHPVFSVVYVGSGKWMAPEVLTIGFDLLKAKKLEKKVKAPAVDPELVARVAATNAKLDAMIANGQLKTTTGDVQPVAVAKALMGKAHQVKKAR
jgi:hypothetical protein